MLEILKAFSFGRMFCFRKEDNFQIKEFCLVLLKVNNKMSRQFMFQMYF